MAHTRPIKMENAIPENPSFTVSFAASLYNGRYLTINSQFMHFHLPVTYLMPINAITAVLP
jgi:hypothetical protein